MTPEVQVTARLCEGTFKEDVLEEVLFDLRSERYTKMTRGSDKVRYIQVSRKSQGVETAYGNILLWQEAWNV